MNFLPRTLSSACALALALGLAGCAGNPARIVPGAPQSALQALGAPSATYPLPGGTRWQYSMQPMGRQVYNIDVNSSGEVMQVEQTLQARIIERIVPGQWTAAQVRETFGAPAEVSRVGRFDGEFWTWRYEEQNNRRFLHIGLSPAGVVTQAYSVDEFVNAPDRN